MKIKFYGAAKTVTGSFFVIETKDIKFGVDCGLFQGSKEIKERNYQDFIINPKTLDFLILSHAHIDHSGLIPKLCKQGFTGPIYCSHATEDLVSVMLPDSGYIQEMEVQRKNRKLKRAGKLLLEPIYTADDARKCLAQFRSLSLDESIQVSDNIEMRLRDAGHILGSSIIELWIEEEEKKTKIVFTGDLGNNNQPIVKDPTIIENADYVVVESTYGNRLHKGNYSRVDNLIEVIDYTMQKGGNLIIPAFAVERTQDLLYDLNHLYKKGQLNPNIDICVDSPLAIAATQIFQKSIEYYDDSTRQLLESGNHPLKTPNLKFTKTTEESMQLNNIEKNAIIISASGMCEAGRIKHHLKHNLWRPESTILFVGFQAQGTLGRKIVDGEKLVRIHGENVAVKADIFSLEAYSAHADKAGILAWLKNFRVPPHAVFLVHGEENSQIALADLIKSEINTCVYIPDWLDEYELNTKDKIRPYDQNIDRAIEAEKLYLDIKLKLHNLYKSGWENSSYNELIETLKKIDSTIK
ncbi:Metallo-beta-lactamase family protein, RNA-specific [Candidatus Syntrophocurvum alkaliphilum]|uniref:Metallo-beta-lactamase family protein, RNA-specific n=1 Tax=Candidatus Syntrophocurvum alkaliphilum TaxID=2293317 RepID=A0A6I6DGP3_9FIRM|nr:MBL fold metallo-hydrolase [Candidatus Syntrophocurvum alkaliphilum]QGT99560.1 Metallo-beta-lactamase family protein, RNA-specific [Candidatus Syntrophocurvum alkaliphilum]